MVYAIITTSKWICVHITSSMSGNISIKWRITTCHHHIIVITSYFFVLLKKTTVVFGSWKIEEIPIFHHIEIDFCRYLCACVCVYCHLNVKLHFIQVILFYSSINFVINVQCTHIQNFAISIQDHYSYLPSCVV